MDQAIYNRIAPGTHGVENNLASCADLTPAGWTPFRQMLEGTGPCDDYTRTRT